jgi:predicted  nucleic acid-binding Zn-ribbon protein
MSDNAPDSPTGLRAEPLDRMEELAKIQERRQHRLMQLRELRQGKPVSSWTTDLSSNDVKLTPPLSSSPKIKKKKSTRASLSKSLPPNVTPPFVNQNLLKKTSSAAGRVEGRGRNTSGPAGPTKREESPHPARLLTRMKSVDAPADSVDFSKRPTSKTGHPAQMPRKTSNTRQGSSTRANAANNIHLNKTPPNPSRVASAFESKKSCGITSDLDEVIAQAMESNRANTEKSNNHSHQDRTPNEHHPFNGVPSKQHLPSLNKLFDNSNAIDYTQSADELSQLISAMQAEFKTLRNAKAQAEATADKLRTEFSLHQQETEAQLLSLSSENDRLKSMEIKLQVELNQGNEKVNKAEKEKCVLRSRLLKAEKERLSAETKVTILEVENAALHKALNDLAKTKCFSNMMPEDDEEVGIEISGYARSA